MATFKEQHNFESRLDIANKIKMQYPQRVPVIVEKAPNSRAPEIEKKKFLAPRDITVAKFLTEIKRHIKLSHQESLYIFVSNNVIPQGSASMHQLYEQHKDPDGFLYITYSSENTFGCDL
eukprot:TRINITY_DN4959_c0_g1_i3.p1 TRINITY_DN4959_c0_g1~~TRINITY_DN4959_c0_g1_i3.p1  ORF type:complete len:120 (-),score=26.82 TRINITY_DN4959_c0_g1_i3:99-458(-)